MDIKGYPKSQPPASKIRSFLAEQLASLDPDKIIELQNSGNENAIPSWQFEHDGWKVIFYPIPKLPEQRGETGVRPLGLISYGAELRNISLAIKKSISKKTSKYGNFDVPYVIAVNVLEKFADERILWMYYLVN